MHDSILDSGTPYATSGLDAIASVARSLSFNRSLTFSDQ